jgi:hypothetical protein
MARKPNLTKLLSTTPEGPITAKDILASGEFRATGEMYVKFVELSIRMKAVGLTACEILGCKPWELPTVGSITPEQLATVVAAVEAAEKAKP